MMKTAGRFAIFAILGALIVLGLVVAVEGIILLGADLWVLVQIVWGKLLPRYQIALSVGAIGGILFGLAIELYDGLT